MKRKSSYSSDQDDLPLAVTNGSSSNSIFKHELIHCDFCEQVLTSRYAIMIHNASHIIIPLEKLKLLQCEECPSHFTTLEDLGTHAKTKHHKTSQVTPKSDYDIILQSIIKKQLVVKCHDIFNDIKSKSNNINLNDMFSKDLEAVCNIDKDDIDIHSDSDIAEDVRLKREHSQSELEHSHSEAKHNISKPKIVDIVDLDSDSDSDRRNLEHVHLKRKHSHSEHAPKPKRSLLKPENSIVDKHDDSDSDRRNLEHVHLKRKHSHSEHAPKPKKNLLKPENSVVDKHNDSDSDRETLEHVHLKRKHSNSEHAPKPKRSLLKHENSIVDKPDDSDSDRETLEQVRLKREHSPLELEHPKLEHSHSHTEATEKDRTVNSQRTEQNTKAEHSSDSDEYLDPIIENEHPQIKFYDSDEEVTDLNFMSDFKFANSSPSNLSSPDFEPVRSRLIFEDDFEEEPEEILPDITYQPKPNMCIIGTLKVTNTEAVSRPNALTLVGRKFGDTSVRSNGTHIDDLVGANIGSKGVEVETYSNSIHYDTLMAPELCDCRYCGRCFGNRMQLITHEMTHIRIRKPRTRFCPYCEKFLAGNYRSLRRHMELNHAEYDEGKKPQIQKCSSCHLSYHKYGRHCQLYHKQDYCTVCNQQYDKQAPHTCGYRLVKLCDMCLTFQSSRYYYKPVGDCSEVGVKQRCSKCNKECFSVNVVQKKSKNSYVKKKKVLRSSNEERLIRIEKRLRWINKFNKCCFCFICLRYIPNRPINPPPSMGRLGKNIPIHPIDVSKGVDLIAVYYFSKVPMIKYDLTTYK